MKFTAPSGQTYRVFNNRPVLIKNKQDAEFFKNHELFSSKEQEEVKQVEEKEVKENKTKKKKKKKSKSELKDSDKN